MTEKDTFLITEAQAAQLLGIAPRTLQVWRLMGSGPTCVRISQRTIRYHKEEVLKWLNSKVQNSVGGSNEESQS